METLQNVVNKLKVNSVNELELQLINKNYGIKSCIADPFKKFISNKLEIIFLSNLNYLCLIQSEMDTILTGNYKDLFKTDCSLSNVDDIKLEKPVVVNNTTVVNNYVTNNVVQEDYWDQTDF